MSQRFCVNHTRAAKQQAEVLRKNATERGYDYQWRQARVEHLKANPLCRHHLSRGQTVAATVVDHKIPHQGDMDLFWDRTNWQSLCTSCHNTKTALEDGGFGNRPAMRPAWLKPSNIKVFLVCGPPASGKSTYIKQHAVPMDIVIDLHDIRRRLTGSCYSRDNNHLNMALRERNRLLGQLKRERPPKRAWLTLLEPKLSGRRWWAEKLKATEVIVLETELGVCEQRIQCDPQRETVATEQREAARLWWRSYSTNTTDKVVRTTA